MSIESQAILAGHVSVEEIARLIKLEVAGAVNVRSMQRPQYKIIEVEHLDGSWSAFNVFLESWAADDYANVFIGPSTMVTVDYSPLDFSIIRSVAAAIGGITRKTEAEPWTEMEPARL
ncbi:hypothetical protein [Sandarakinorhabdus sp.]|uniref:hypothetical protein n=1 Tax=Sandarakinorhabdus sp. TaxID=1916663 RepID=UPI003F713A53